MNRYYRSPFADDCDGPPNRRRSLDRRDFDPPLDPPPQPHRAPIGRTEKIVILVTLLAVLIIGGVAMVAAP